MNIIKYKKLKVGQCYLNKEGDFVIAIMGGTKKHGYTCAASCVTNPPVWLGSIKLFSLLVLDDGNWREIDVDMFNITSKLHYTGHVVKIPIGVSNKDLPVISKKI